MAGGIPKPKRLIWRVLGQTQIWEFFVAIAVPIGGITSGNKYLRDGETFAALAVFAGTVIIFVGTVAKIYVTWRQHRIKESTHELEGCLHTLHAVMTAGMPPGSNPKLRCTIHVPDEHEKDFHQVLEYVGDERGGKGNAGRSFPCRCGIIGKAFSLKEQDYLTAYRKSNDYEGYVRELKEDYHYTEQEARRLNPGSMAWMAICLKDSADKVKGVVYLDSVDRDFFTDDRQQIALNCCVGIARFVLQRYS